MVVLADLLLVVLGLAVVLVVAMMERLLSPLPMGSDVLERVGEGFHGRCELSRLLVGVGEPQGVLHLGDIGYSISGPHRPRWISAQDESGGGNPCQGR